jgi:hypothetical protein
MNTIVKDAGHIKEREWSGNDEVNDNNKEI